MARAKVTSSDIHARLAKGECANFRNGCQGRMPCTVVNGEPCQYFTDYVQPLLDMPDFAQRYAREAKVKLALNPDAKVVRKRRQAGAPTLDLPAEAAPEPKAAGKPAETPTLKPRVKEILPVHAAPAAHKTREKAPVAATPPKPHVKTAPAPTPAVAAKEQPRKQAIETPPMVQAAPAPKKPEKTEVAREKPAKVAAEVLPEKAPSSEIRLMKPTGAPPARRQTRAPKPDAAPALELTAKPEVAPRRTTVTPPPHAAAKTAHAKEPPAEKRSIMITPQLELILDFPLEAPTRTASKRR